MQDNILRQLREYEAYGAQFRDAAWRAKVLADTHGVAVDKQAREVNLRNLKTLFDAGVKVGFGTDSGATA